MSFVLKAIAGIAAWAAMLQSVLAADITGAGSSFAAPIIAKWSATYAASTGNTVKYQSIGSGSGISEIKAQAVDFGITDAPLKPRDLQKFALAQFPLVVGGIVPVLNVQGIKPGEIHFTGALLADIFLGKVKTWNDPAIAKLNPGLPLPATQIKVVHRSDSSGTTFNWTNYLSKVSPEWQSKVGVGMAVDWPTGAGGRGNEGVTALVQQAINSIGYVEYAYVLQNKLVYGLVQNRAGSFVKPGVQSFQAAAAGADWSKATDFDVVITESPGAQTWPVAATSLVLMPKTPKDSARSRAAINFFRWALTEGQKQATELEYVPLPPSLVSLIEAYWKSAFATVN